jgi:hypothetical protein
VSRSVCAHTTYASSGETLRLPPGLSNVPTVLILPVAVSRNWIAGGGRLAAGVAEDQRRKRSLNSRVGCCERPHRKHQFSARTILVGTCFPGLCGTGQEACAAPRAGQKSIFRPSWTFRPRPALLITPKVAEPKDPPGEPNGGVLVILNASPRNCNRGPSFRMKSR